MSNPPGPSAARFMGSSAKGDALPSGSLGGFDRSTAVGQDTSDLGSRPIDIVVDDDPVELRLGDAFLLVGMAEAPFDALGGLARVYGPRFEPPALLGAARRLDEHEQR